MIATVVAHGKELIEAALGKTTVVLRARRARPSSWEFRARRLIQRSVLRNRQASLQDGLNPGNETHRSGFIAFRCSRLEANSEQDSVALTSPDSADSSAFAEKPASFSP
jgi:hypothetical protein